MAGNSIFLGVTTSPCRDHVAQCALATKSEQYIHPCAGRFSVVEAAIKHGGKASQMFCSDIGLFSSIIGALAMDDVEAIDHRLGIRIDWPTELRETPKNDGSAFDECADILLLMKYGQFKPNNQHALNLRREIRSNWKLYRGQVRESLEKLAKSLAGIDYQIADVWDVVRAHKDDPDACLFVNVPAYKGGYTKMFANDAITWAAPTVPEYDYGKFPELLAMLYDAKASALVYVQRSLQHATQPGWTTVYAEDYGRGRFDYVLANPTAHEKASALRVYAPQRTAADKPKHFPIYDDQEITPDSTITFVRVDAATALYYRDLFVHKLGSTSAETYYLMLIDGRVVTALGLNNRWLRKFRSPFIGELFGISKSSERYKRLGKLFMLCLTSKDFAAVCDRDLKLGVHKPRGIRTTSITTHWEGKTDRSVMRIASRNKLKDGRFHIVYEADFTDHTFKDCVQLWLKKWGKVSRPSGASST